MRVLLFLPLTTRPKRLDSPPMIDLFPLTTGLTRLDSPPPIDLLPLSKLRGAALRRELRNLASGRFPRECGPIQQDQGSHRQHE